MIRTWNRWKAVVDAALAMQPGESLVVDVAAHRLPPSIVREDLYSVLYRHELHREFRCRKVGNAVTVTRCGKHD